MPQRCLCAKMLYFIHLVRLGLQKEGKALWEQKAVTQPHEASYIARASEITRWGTRFEAFTTVRMLSQEFQVLLPTLCHGLVWCQDWLCWECVFVKCAYLPWPFFSCSISGWRSTLCLSLWFPQKWSHGCDSQQNIWLKYSDTFNLEVDLTESRT